MRHVLNIIKGSVIAIAVFMTVYGKDIDLSLYIPTVADTTDRQPEPYTSSDNQTALEEDDRLELDTVMYAKDHAFGYSGDISMWGGWYLDTICVGYDNMLQYDSVGPSTLRLSLITRDFVVDLGDSDVINKIKDFINPIAGFRRFRKRYEECLELIYFEGRGFYEYMGEFSFEMDYPDSCHENAGKINRFICELTELSESEKAKVSDLSAFYAGFNSTKYYKPVYTGNTSDMQCLSDFLAHRTFEN
ncbi:MAG: hypothetical protein K2N96_06345 [Muribaculaceae bacterium]|nr:hypothetical protein [Muribaculaceae bacterium]